MYPPIQSVEPLCSIGGKAKSLRRPSHGHRSSRSNVVWVEGSEVVPGLQARRPKSSVVITVAYP